MTIVAPNPKTTMEPTIMPTRPLEQVALRQHDGT